MTLLRPNRRTALALISSAALPTLGRAQAPKKVAALFAGRIDDRGFMQAGYDGLKLAEARLGVSIAFKQGVQPKPEDLTGALWELAAAGPFRKDLAHDPEKWGAVFGQDHAHVKEEQD